MADISKCSGVSKDGRKCPIRRKCYRYTVPPDPQWQAYSDFEYDRADKSCPDFIRNTTTTIRFPIGLE